MQAVVMGPFLMAGITESSREIDADPESVPSTLRELTAPPGDIFGAPLQRAEWHGLHHLER